MVLRSKILLIRFLPKAITFSSCFVYLVLGKQQMFLFNWSVAPKSLRDFPPSVNKNKDSITSMQRRSLKKKLIKIAANVERSLFRPAILPKKSISYITVLLWSIWLALIRMKISALAVMFSSATLKVSKL